MLQDIFNLLPNMNVEALSKSLTVKSNDMMSSIYVASLVRSILALHKCASGFMGGSGCRKLGSGACRSNGQRWLLVLCDVQALTWVHAPLVSN